MEAQRMYDLVEKLSFVRVSGTDEECKAAEILMDELKAIGANPVLESFDVEDGNVSHCELRVIEPYEKSYPVSGFKRAKNTAEGGQTFDFLYVEDALPVNLVNAKGKFVLINERLNYDKYKKLAEAGVAGVLTYSGLYYDEEDKTDLDEMKVRPQWSEAFGFLTAVNTRAYYAQEMLQKGATKVCVNLQGQLTNRTSHNVIVEIKGTEFDDQPIAFGGHYDSVPFSSGAYDNAAGSAILVELVRYFLANPPKRTLRFVWYGSEEQGLLGSKYDVQAHPDFVKDCKLMFNVDLAGTLMGSNFVIVTGEESGRQYIDSTLKQAGFAAKVTKDIYSSDCMPFANLGVPCINMGRFGTGGQHYGHNRFDVMEFISASSLKNTGEMCKLIAEKIVNAAVLPIDRKLPEDIVDKVKDYLKIKSDKEQ